MRITDMITHDKFALISYQLVLTTFIGNEWGQQMRIQVLILGFNVTEGLKRVTLDSFNGN